LMQNQISFTSAEKYSPKAIILKTDEFCFEHINDLSEDSRRLWIWLFLPHGEIEFDRQIENEFRTIVAALLL